MDILIIKDKLVIIDYINDKEFIVKQNIGTFIKSYFDPQSTLFKSISLKFYDNYSGYKKSIGHYFSYVYSADKYVNYKDSERVKQIEQKATIRHELYKETLFDNNIFCDYYFLNPLIFKNSLRQEHLLGAILYFSTGIKCSASFNNQPHIKKFIPSNGARYPFIPIILINKCGNIASGEYQYHTFLHSLIRRGDCVDDKDFQVRIIFKGVVERVMSRYPNGVAYRDLLFDLGHLIATLKKCLSHYKIKYIMNIDSNNLDEINLMELEFLSIDLELDTL